MAPSPVTVLIGYRAQPGKETDGRRALMEIVAQVLAAEPDCHGIEILEEAGAPGRFLLHEQWTSQEAYTGPHFQTPHLQDFIARAPGIFAGPPEITFWHQVPRE